MLYLGLSGLEMPYPSHIMTVNTKDFGRQKNELLSFPAQQRIPSA